MPAPPTLEDLLTILTRVSDLRANFVDAKGEEVELCFKFKRGNLGPTATYVFECPSMILPEIAKLLGADEVMEKAFRENGPRNTIEEVITFFQTQADRFKGKWGGLEGAMQFAFCNAAVTYLRELDRRRREIDRRAQTAEQVRRKQAEEDLKRKLDEEIRRKEAERDQAKREAHARWEREEADKRQQRSRRTSDSGYASGPPPGFGNFANDAYERYMWDEIYRASGIDPREFYKSQRNWEGVFSGDEEPRKKSAPPPPSSGMKRKWYEILGCAPGASRDEIRRAAREASKGLHPDKNADPNALKKFQEISEAKTEGLQGCT